MSGSDVAALRAELEAADRRIVEAVSHRQRLVETIAAVKLEAGLPLRDGAQESAVLTRIEAHARDLGVDPFLVGRVFRELIGHSVRVQQFRAFELTQPRAPFLVAFQGAAGAYGHAAAIAYFRYAREEATYRAYPTFREVASAVAAGEVAYGVLPIENSTAGSINETYDLLSTMDLSIVGEEIVSVDHCLLGVEPRPASALRRVLSHPQALAQCSEFLASLGDCELVPFANTALAAEKVQQDRDPLQAALASEDAGRRCDLVVLARDIANERVNLTRFVVVGRDVVAARSDVACKTSIVFVTRHEHGALLRCLDALAERGLNLTKLESRPRSGVPWEYQFYVDFDGNAADPTVQDALVELKRHALQVRTLGSYPSRTGKTARVERLQPRASRS